MRRNEINRKLKAARVMRGLTQAQLGAKLGRSQSWVCELERGQMVPSDLDVALICRVLKAQPDAIFPTDEAREHILLSGTAAGQGEAS